MKSVPRVRRLALLGLLSGSGLLTAQVTVFHPVTEESGIEPVEHITIFYGNGASAADYDGDGDIDFYLTTDDDIPDRLYQNDGLGHFTDVAQTVGIVETHNNRAALWFDYDGDGRLDLVLAGEKCVNNSCVNPARLSLYRQLPDGQFEAVSTEAAGLIIGPDFDLVPYYAIGGLAAADFNQDEYLDLLLSVWGGGVKLFLNQGNGTFTDITAAAGLTLEVSSTPWQPMCYDFDQDGLIDIYCNIDFAPNKLWINQGDNTFVDLADTFGLANAFNEMGMAMNDFDNDGDLDIYITNITKPFPEQPLHNLLYEQRQSGGRIHFIENGLSRGVGNSGWDWGTTFIDINNDGRQDLLTTNGWNSPSWAPDRSRAWLNTLAGFADVSEQVGFNDRLAATSLLGFDKDRDGDVDILQSLKRNEDTMLPAILYENRLEEQPNAGNYLNIQPRMDGPNRYAIGSTVTLVAEGLTSARLISAGCSFYGQEPAEAWFGLGAREAIREVIVRWPNDQVSIYPDLAINQTTELSYDFIAPPTELTATFATDEVQLHWRDNASNETGYRLYRSTDSTFATFTTVELPANATAYTDSGIELSQTYYYRVRAFKPNVSSDDSNTARIQPGGPKPAEEGNFIFPNPVRSEALEVKSTVLYQGPVQFHLFDRTGRACWSAERLKETPYALFQFDAQVPAGLYFLFIKMGEREEWHKVVIF
ncbi:MAG: VCBS repeat-containing protein [Lewinella sp.]|nr:VCBS repeat-containing protein [Lewinella sp.]